MIEFLFHPANAPFTIALGVMLVLGLLEIIGFVMGVGVSNLLDNILPDFGAADLDADVDVDVDLDADVDAGVDLVHAGVNNGTLKLILRPLSWLGLGKVPVLILLVIFLTTFGLIGLGLQYAVLWLSGERFMIPSWIAWLPVLVATMPVVRGAAGLFAHVSPKETTTAISSRTFVDRIAVITTGAARRGLPAEAKFRDEFGRTHYVMVEPEEDNEVLESGTSIVLTRRRNGKFRAVRNTYEIPKVP